MIFEIYNIDQEDTKILNEMAKEEFCLNDFKKKYGKNRIERLIEVLKELELIKEVKTKPSTKERGRNLKVFKIEVEEWKTHLYSARKKRFIKIRKKLF